MTILMNMSPVINDCLYRNMYRYKKIVCVDLDEYIVPRQHSNYRQLIEAIDTTHPYNHPAKSYMFRNSYFWLDFGPTLPQPWYLLTQRFVKRMETSPYGYACKSFTDPRTCVGLQNHFCWVLAPSMDIPAWSVDVLPEYAQNHHYKKCHFDAYLGKPGRCKKMMEKFEVDETMLKFQPELLARVLRTVKDLGKVIPGAETQNGTLS